MSETDNRKKQLGEVSLSFLRVSEFVCFFVALIFVGILFYTILAGEWWTKLIVIFIASVISLIVLKQRFLYAVSLKKRNGRNNDNSVKKQVEFIGKFTPRTLVLLFSRTFIFNIISQAFPVLLIDFIIILISAFFGHVSIDSGMWTILGVIGVILALFKFYVTSQQHSSTEVIETLLQYAHIQIEEQTSHINFVKWMRETKGEKDPVVITINNLLDNHKYIKGQLESLFDQSSPFTDRKNNRFVKRLNFRNIYLSNSPYINNSDLFFQELETSNIVKDLPKAYEEFYLTKVYCQVIDDIQNKYNLTEIGRIIITNINLLDESVVSLVDVSALSDFIDYICDNNKNDGDASEISGSNKDETVDIIKTSIDAKRKLTEKVLSKIIREVFKSNLKE